MRHLWSIRLWVATYLTVALTSTGAWLLLDQRLAKQTGLRQQVWLTGDFEGAPFLNDLSPGATLDFLDDDARLPRQFFSARWHGYWYVCTAPGFLDTRLRYAAWRSSYSSRASSGVRYASFSRRQHWL